VDTSSNDIYKACFVTSHVSIAFYKMTHTKGIWKVVT